MAFDFNKDINEMMKEFDFCCGECKSENIRVKDTVLEGITLNVTVCCNDCDEEWTERFKLSYIGYTNSKGKCVGVCRECGASIDLCECCDCEDE